ncbi:PorP/SprF family type IX secretion system membrane protein [Carboxylicivirga sp. M1479]|uniref:PorP/SprF family type IX secretion system membrane protein n=1 Tax=Carboxylicivirga sp. M1479 TaxID=2594476 RepID=UPI0011784823|nr:PorP/SprF family type IX secretion system membrane protein [Carboxylicivirga sp. M1479]TRX70836.1 type IX secretion system membrane protein PorP/SprF [Carboxylicivirga sp. M1479]
MIKKLLNIILVFCSFTAVAQDPHFSQFYANPLYLSPSLAGATDGGRLIVNYRNQWPEVSKAFSTYSISFDNFFSKFNSGIGFYLIQDKAGSAGLTTTNAAFQYSYNLVISDYWQIIPAIQFAYGNKAVDFSKAIFPDQPPINSSSSGAYDRLSNEQVHYIDLASSVFLYSPKYWIGLTVDHLAKPNYTFMNEDAKAELKYVVFGGMNIWSERRRNAIQHAFSASFRYQRQDQFNQLDLGVYWHNSPLEIGVWYRGLPVFNNAHESAAVNQDAIIALLAYDLGSIRIGYSYDITIGSLGWSTAGAHELSLIFEFNQRARYRSGGRRPAVPCSETANPLNSIGGKYTRQKRKLY